MRDLSSAERAQIKRMLRSGVRFHEILDAMAEFVTDRLREAETMGADYALYEQDKQFFRAFLRKLDPAFQYARNEEA